MRISLVLNRREVDKSNEALPTISPGLGPDSGAASFLGLVPPAGKELKKSSQYHIQTSDSSLRRRTTLLTFRQGGGSAVESWQSR